MTEVFISYARADQAIARRTASALQKAGFDVWWDADLPAHRAYSDVIEKHLEEAKAVVVLWSRLSAKSEWVRAEADFARARHKLVQAGLDGSLPPIPFNQVQCADLKGWRGSAGHPGWSKLKQSVAALVSGEEPVRTEAAAPRWWSQRRFQLAAAFGALLLLAALWLVPRWLEADDGKRPVVAVLPFESLDRRDESLVAGIWEDTRQAIGRNPQLLVLGPNTSEEIADKGSGSARKLADYLVEASVRSLGNRIRISANLVRTEDGTEIWNKSFDRKLDDVFALQSEIAGEIEGHIRGRLARRGGTQPENIATSGEVYALYSDARTKIRKRQMDKFAEAHEQLERVVRMDPNFAPGWATLAVAKKFGFSTRGEASSAEVDARRAIALAPNLAAGHAALGFVLGSAPGAQAELRRAVALDPNDVEAIHWLANSMDPDTQRDEKLRLYSKVIELEPLWWPAILNKINLLFEVGDQAAVDRELARVESFGDKTMSAGIKAEILQKRGDLSGAINVLVAYSKTAPAEARPFLLAMVSTPLYQLGQFEIADRLSPPPTRFVPYIRRNDPKALDMFEKDLPPEGFWTFGYLATMGGRVYLLNGEGARLAKLYRAVAKTPEEFMAVVGEQRLIEIAPTAALALRAAGDQDQAQALLALAEVQARKLRARNPQSMVEVARIYAVQGRTDEAIDLLSTAIRAGWLPPFLPIHTDIALDPPLNELRKDPRFERLRQQILGHLAKERAELGAITLN